MNPLISPILAAIIFLLSLVLIGFLVGNAWDAFRHGNDPDALGLGIILTAFLAITDIFLTIPIDPVIVALVVLLEILGFRLGYIFEFHPRPTLK